jgi:hypothetical protein
MPVAEYFVLPDGKIPSFNEDALYPFVKGDGKRYQGAHLASGTVIKLYDYQIPSRFQTGFRGTREALNENLVETILPFLILDFRQTPDPKRTGFRAEGIDDRSFYGMEYLLLNAHEDRSDGEVREGDKQPEDCEASGLGRIAVANIKTEQLGEISSPR